MTGEAMVAVLDADPDLAAGLDAQALAHARREALAPLVSVRTGEWSSVPVPNPSGHLGLLVLDGLLTHSQLVGELCSTEFLGAGDILRPWISASHAGAPPRAVWRAIVPTRIAVLDQDFAWRIRRWPQIPATLLERATIRSRSLGFTLAIHRAVRVQDRVQLMLWHLADRWGHVTPRGTVLPIPLTHAALAELVGARRSPVTVALGDLKREGLVERGPNGSWLLRGDPQRPSNRTSSSIVGAP